MTVGLKIGKNNMQTGRNLTFFYKHNVPSGKIRGQQICEYLGAKEHLIDGYENDTCIYVKHIPPKDFPEHSYIDIVDSKNLVNWANENPRIGVIAISKTAKTYLMQKLKRDDIHLIPEHHCNFERKLRTRKDVTTVGYIGARTGSSFPADIKERFAEIGLDFKYFVHKFNMPGQSQPLTYETRESVVDFYNTIDIQVMGKYIRHKAIIKLKNPLKLANAGSFGIPTVAYPELNFIEEFKDCFVEAKTIDEMILQCEILKNNREFYKEMSDKALSRSQRYHISKIAPLYYELGNKNKSI